MSDLTKDVRGANREFAGGMFEVGGNLLMLALVFGGSAFLLQWAFWFIAVGVLVSKTIGKGADAADWAYSKLPGNPFAKDTKEGGTDEEES